MPDLDAEAYAKLKAAALDLLLKPLPDADRDTINQFLQTVEAQAATALSSVDTRKALAGLQAEVQKLASVKTNSGSDAAIAAMQSPPFYFFFGLILLVCAFLSNGYGLNSSLTFLVAMLGVAILLYGTGSQAAGTFGGDPGKAQKLLVAPLPGAAVQAETATSGAPSVPALANIAIAGGAAVLTAFFGWGVITKSPEIRQVFRDYDQYKEIRVEFCKFGDRLCSGSGASAGDKAPAATGLNHDLLAEIERRAYLQTGLGHKAFARVTDDGLEFVVFNRDLGAKEDIKLVVDASINGLSYTINPTYFSIADRPKADCLVLFGNDTCLMRINVDDSLDANRAPRLVIKATVIQSTVVTDKNGAQTSSSPIIPG
ncbi:hypothetical protein [Mesorhizobium australicum]|uniref:hypothetical protein n=1 Tax=Mesorhizobium australicum TaxID=536018 RepID=UPI0033390EEA